MLTKGGGVGEMLTMAEERGEEGSGPPFFG